MKNFKAVISRPAALAAICGAVWLFAGCQNQPQFADYDSITSQAQSTNASGTPDAGYKPLRGQGHTDVFQVGDTVKITFNSASDQPPLPPYSETVKDDGRITPPVIGPVVATNKSPGQLQAELQEKYNVFFKFMTVTLTSDQRYYYVSGEVKNPGPKTYLGETDIIQAISSAGDFTDFANKHKVRLTRSNGKTEIIDVIKVIENPDRNVRVFPNDKIVVPRRFF